MRTTKTTSDLKLRRGQLFEMIHYVPHAGQLRLHKSRAPRRIIAAGSRWGKSSAAAVETLIFLLEPRGQSRGWLCAPTYDLTDRIFERVCVLVERYFPHRIRELNTRTRVIRFRNLAGELSEVRAKSCDKPAGLLGESLDWLVIDEAARLTRVVWEEHVAARLVDRRGRCLMISTPRGRDWFYREWKRGQHGRDPSYESWRCPTTENPHINADLIEEEHKRLAPDVYEQEYLAEFVGRGPEECSTCGWPDSFAQTCVIVEDDGPLPLCVDCDRHVDAKGHTVCGQGSDGKPFVTIIELRPRFANVDLPPLPGGHADENVTLPPS